MSTDKKIDEAMARFGLQEDPKDVFDLNADPYPLMAPIGSTPELLDLPLYKDLAHAYSKTFLGTAPRAIYKFLEGTQHEPEEGFMPLIHPLMKGRNDIAHLVEDVQSEPELIERMQSIDEQFQEDAHFAQGRSYDSANFISALFTPENFIPVVAPYAKVRTINALGQNLLFNAGIYGSIEATGLYVDDTRTIEQATTHAAMATAMVSIFGTMLSPSARTLRTRNLAAQRDDIITENVEVDIMTGDRYFGENSAGAAEVPRNTRLTVEREVVEQEIFDAEGLVSAFGLEKIGYNPVIRMTNANVLEVRQLVEEIVDLGGLIKLKNQGDIRTAISVEREVAVEFNPKLSENIIGRQSNYMLYRGRVETDSTFVTGIKIGVLNAREWVGEKITGNPRPYLSYREFQEEVGKGLTRGDVHEIPEIHAQIAQDRIIYDEIGKQAQELGMFSVPFERSIARLEKQKAKILEDVKDAGKPSIRARIRTQRIEATIAQLEKKIDNIEKYGPTLGRSDSYFPRIWRIDRILSDDEIATGGQQVFRGRLVNHFINNEAMTKAEAAKASDEVIQTLVNNDTPYIRINEKDLVEDFLKEGSPVKERMLNIKDEDFLDFMELDSEAVMRFYIRTMGIDIGLTRRFGSFTMKDQIDEVIGAYQKKIDAVSSLKEKKSISGERDIITRDIRALRDRLRGTFGMPQNPFSPVSRFIRAAKMVNTVTMLGGAAISALPDPARVIMTEGLATTFDYGFRSMTNAQRSTIRKMSVRELNLAGEALEITLGLRALQFMDAGDMFGRRFMFERQLHNAQGAFFLINGLHLWNNIMKEWAGTVISARIIEASLKISDGTADKALKTRMNRSFIDEDIAKEIAKQVREHGEEIKLRNGRTMWMPNTERWTNDEAIKTFRASLATDVNRTIVTPGAGDRSVWTSTEFGSMVAQFKSFGQAATQRVLISGLQERNAAFFMGSVALVGMGMVVNEIKRAQFGIKQHESIKGKIAEGVDRSGIGGWFMDANNAIETLSDNKLGMRPLLNEAPPYSPSQRRVMGTIFGPTGSQVQNAIEVGSDVLTGDISKRTGRGFRRMLPLNNHPIWSLVQ